MLVWYSNSEEDTLVLLALKILVNMKIQARLVDALLKKNTRINYQQQSRVLLLSFPCLSGWQEDVGLEFLWWC